MIGLGRRSRAARGGRRRALRRCAVLIGIAIGIALGIEIAVSYSHKALAVPWASEGSFAAEWRDLPTKCKRRLAFALPGREDDAWAVTRARSAAYVDMRAIRGIEAFDSKARATQGLRVEEMFSQGVDGKIVPNLLRLNIPVRAIVIPFPVGVVSEMLHRGTVKQLRRFGFREDVDVYLQNPEMFHFSVFHASHHLDEHAVSEAEFDEEVRSVRDGVTNHFCPIKAVLERVSVTAGGAVVAGWNVEKSSAGDPRDLRAQLRRALPNAPAKQLVSNVNILHTTLARLIKPPKGVTDDARLARELSRELSDEFCGLQLTLDRAWFVSEHHKLALALRGAVDKVDLPFDCIAN